MEDFEVRRVKGKKDKSFNFLERVLLYRMINGCLWLIYFSYLDNYNNIDRIWINYLSHWKPSQSFYNTFPHTILGGFWIMKKNKPQSLPFPKPSTFSTSSFLFFKCFPSSLKLSNKAYEFTWFPNKVYEFTGFCRLKLGGLWKQIIIHHEKVREVIDS